MGVSDSRFSTIFFEGTDSPVRDASSTCRDAISISLASAGILLPVSNRMISPGTSSEASISFSMPFRMTLARSAVNFLKASMAFSALYSWTKPNTALSITIIAMTTASIFSPMTTDIAIATRRMMMIKEVNCRKNIFAGVVLFFFSISFVP